jgi:acyl carrier protein
MEPAPLVSNRARLKQLLLDVFLLDPGEFRFDLTRSEIESWDSLGTVSLALGIEEVFGHHLTPAEATGLASVADIITVLSRRGIDLEES